MSSIHKRAIQEREVAADNSPANGKVIRSVGDMTVYDIVFTPTGEGDFSRPAEPMTGETLLEDLSTIEAFFAHFQIGIMRRMEEASVR